MGSPRHRPSHSASARRVACGRAPLPRERRAAPCEIGTEALRREPLELVELGPGKPLPYPGRQAASSPRGEPQARAGHGPAPADDSRDQPARPALKRSASVRGSCGGSSGEWSRTIRRTCSPTTVPPGSRVRMTSNPECLEGIPQASRNGSVLPAPSGPSMVMNQPPPVAPRVPTRGECSGAESTGRRRAARFVVRIQAGSEEQARSVVLVAVARCGRATYGRS